MLSALIGIALAQVLEPEIGAPAEDTLEIAGEQVAIRLPDQETPFPVGSRSITLEGYEYVFGPAGNLLTRVAVDPEDHTASAGSIEYHVKFLVLSRIQLLEAKQSGGYEMRRMTLERFQITELKEAIGGFVALVRQATGGMIEVVPHFELDDDLVFLEVDGTHELGTPLLGAEYLDSDVAPGINKRAFAAMDGRYRGPFGSVIVVHAGLFDGIAYEPMSPPATLISFAGYGDSDPATGLANLFLDTFAHHVSERAAPAFGGERSASWLKPDYSNTLVRAWESDLHSEYWQFADLSTTSIEVSNTSSLRLTPANATSESLFSLPFRSGDVPNGKGSVLPGNSASQRWVSWWAVPLLTRPGRTPGNFEAIAFGRQGDGRYYVLIEAGDGWASGSDAALFGVSDELAAIEIDEEAIPFSVGPRDVREEAGAVFVRDRGITRRGYTVVQQSSSPLNSSGQVFSIEFQSVSRDPYLLEFRGLHGNLIGSVALVAPVLGTVDFPIEDLLTYHPVSSEEWTTINVDCSPFGPVHEVRIAVPAVERLRESRGLQAGYGFRNSRWGSFEVSAPIVRDVSESHPLALVSEPLDEEEAQLILQGLSSADSDVELIALGALARVRLEEAVPILESKAASASPTIAYLAARALRHQGEMSRDSLARILEIGPFDHNRRFAGEALMHVGTEGHGPKFAALAASRSWRTRRVGVDGLFSDPTPQSTIFVMGLIDDPATPVRLMISRLADADHSLANRRLLWLAVNDPSEQIRSETYVKLLSCSDAEIRTEALNGVRDESDVVQRAVLEHIIDNPESEFRRALQVAVIDRNPEIRALALDGFRTQSGPVELGEIQNVLTDSDHRVQLALVRLAVEKSLVLPEETVGMLNNSPHPGVREEAERLRR